MTRHSPVVNLLIKASEELPRAHVSALPASRIHLARDRNGNGVSPTSKEAVYWSSTGIIIKLDPVERGVSWPGAGNVGEDALRFLDAAIEAEFGAVPHRNHADRQGVLAVSKVFKRAIQLAEMDEPEARVNRAGSRYGSHPKGDVA